MQTPKSVLLQLDGSSRVPVYGGIASRSHPTAKLAEHLGESLACEEGRRLMVQTGC